MSTTPDIANSPLCVAVQLWLVEYLETRASLVRGEKRVPVIGRRKTNIQNDIAAAMAELGGACLYVQPMLPLRFNANVPGPYIDLAEIRVSCLENDALNTELPDVFELQEAVARELMGLTIPNLPISALLPAEPKPVEPLLGGTPLQIDVIFHVTGQYQPRLEEQ